MKKINGSKDSRFISVFLIIIFFLVIIAKGTYSDDNKLNRENLQDLIVSTALSYYYNHEYSDYEQYSMEDSLTAPYNFTSFNWRNVTNSPEMVNRGNQYTIDCSSFVLMTYLNSLGYDMSEELEAGHFSNNAKFYRFDEILTDEDVSSFNEDYGFKGYKHNTADAVENGDYREGYWTYGRGFSTGVSASAKYVALSEGIIAGNEYINDDSTNTSAIVYHYEVTLKEDENGKLVYDYDDVLTEAKKVRDDIINTLQPGDALFYRKKSKKTGDTTGHVMVYVGDVINTGEKGFLHAAGNDFEINDEGEITDYGVDDYSVRYDTWDDWFITHIFNGVFEEGVVETDPSTSKISYDFSIIRPINTYLNGEEEVEQDNLEISSNVIARNELSRLKIEQYQDTSDSFSDLGDYKNISNYNSVNNGDVVTYNLELTNMSEFEYCSNGKPEYATEEECEYAKINNLEDAKINGEYTEWKIAYGYLEEDEKNYSGLTIVGKIPDGTTYVDCTNECNISEDGKTLTWNNIDISSNETLQLGYTVKVNTDEDIVNSGMTIITESGEELVMGQLTTKVNPTIIEGVNKNEVIDSVDEFNNLVDDGKIIFDSSVSLDSFKNVNSDTSTGLGELGFIKYIYYDSFGIDLTFLSLSNIKTAIFNKASDYNVFAKKTDVMISALSNEKYQKINKMLVKGMYGGRLLKGNDNGDRAKLLMLSYLQFGDILVTYSRDMSSSNVYLVLESDPDVGTRIVEFNNLESGEDVIYYSDESDITSSSIFRSIYAQGLFVVLRPTQLYGTTVNYDYQGGTGDTDTYIAYNTYQNLTTPTKDSYSILFNYNGGVGDTDSVLVKNSFDGWYADDNFTKMVENTSDLEFTETHTLYAKWKNDSIELPNAIKDDYTFAGWYSDRTLETKVGLAGDSYTATKNVTLYAKWESDAYTVSYDGNGSTSGSMTDTECTYESDCTLRENTYTKTGYTFLGWSEDSSATSATYSDKYTFSPFTETRNITLYAVWKNNTYTVTYDANGGSGEPASQTKTHGVTLTLSTTKPIRDGYTFSGWNTVSDGSGTNYVSGDSYTENVDVTLYAIWKSSTYTVTYDANGGSGEPASQTKTHGVTLTLSTTKPIRDGYTFLGWGLSTDTAEVTYDPGDSYTANSGATLYAVWISDDENLSFDDDIVVDRDLNYIKFIECETTVKKLLGKVSVVVGSFEITTKDGDKKNNSDIIATGDKLVVYVDGTKKDEYVISVRGDSSGDGKINSIDLVQMRKHIVGWVNPNTNVIERKTGIYFHSLDMNKDGIINSIDLVRMRKRIVGLAEE